MSEMSEYRELGQRIRMEGRRLAEIEGVRREDSRMVGVGRRMRVYEGEISSAEERLKQARARVESLEQELSEARGEVVTCLAERGAGT